MSLTEQAKKKYRQEYLKDYRVSYNGRRSKRIADWRRAGIIVENNDFEKFYDVIYYPQEFCQMCGKILTYDRYTTHSTKCLHHDHNVKDDVNVIAITCNACNTSFRKTNTSGEPNVYYYKKIQRWCFEKKINGKRYLSPDFKTKEEAIKYKYDFETTFHLKE